MQVPFSYLYRQFAEVDAYLADIKKNVLTGDYTLGAELIKFECDSIWRIARRCV